MAVTTWNRLESLPSSPDISESLRARVADPLWMLARQLQFGELRGEDAGAPVEAVLRVDVAPIDRFHAGPIGRTPSQRSVDVDGALIEPIVEQQPLDGHAAELRWRIDAGQHLVRLLRSHGAPTQVPKLLAAFGFDGAELDAVDAALTGLSVMTHVGRRVPDGAAVAGALTAHRGRAATLSAMPADLGIAASLEAKVVAAANEFLDWYANHHLDPERSSWQPERLEYAFAVGAALPSGSVTLRADEYHGGRLDWYHLDADHRASLGPTAASRSLERRTMPTRAFFSGMPADRFWEFENDVVRFGAGSVGRTDLAHLLLDEFALTYGNDWYTTPLRIPAGSLCEVTSIVVHDTFGVATAVPRASTLGSSRWTMFELSTEAGAAARVGGLSVLPAAVGQTQLGDPIEEVAWFRDEMANVVWAVERRVASPVGGHVERAEAIRRAGPVARQHIDVDIDEAELVYRLNSPIPEQWFPLVPVMPASASSGVTELELRPITRFDAAGRPTTAQPLSEVLRAASPLRIAEAEVARDGTVTGSHWQLARDVDGRYLLWLSHRRRTGSGEGSSGLVFDIARPA